jgi:hypothetical protein
MPRRPATIPTVRSLATEFLQQASIREPPLAAEVCLDRRRLRIAEQSLDELLRDAHQSGLHDGKVDAMLEVQERSVWLRDGLHPNQERFCTLHEVGHDAIPWQRELLHYCSIFDLPPSVQREFELEATAFAVECLFLGERFMEEALSLPFGLAAPMQLSDRYDVSYEAAFRHYVEWYPRPCCLLISRPLPPSGALWVAGPTSRYELRYYVPSPSFRSHIPPKQQFSCRALWQVYMGDVVEHELPIGRDERRKVYYAQSFTNSYKVFTLICETPFGS